MIIVLGANGQLGRCFKKIDTNSEIIFKTREDLDISNIDSLLKFFATLEENSTIINCAAYTNVDLAEDEKEKAFLINHDAVKNIALTCNKFQHKLIHISTDYVFDGLSPIQYNESHSVNPQSVYGCSKLAGEKEIEKICHSYLIIRTSWLYSEFGHNFVKSIKKLTETRNDLGIVADQVGTPTYAIDLAASILKIIPQFEKGTKEVLHFSNEGVCSWYDFALEIGEETSCTISPIETKNYPTKAKRPAFSVLNKNKIKSLFEINIPHWKTSLKSCLKNLS